MKKIVSLILCLLMLPLTVVNAETAEEERLIIAIAGKSDSLQLNAEEAFFRVHPNAVIEYRLYDSREQFEAMLMTNPDFDVAIVEDYMIAIMAKKGYLQSLDELGINEYPQTLLDYEDELSYDGKLLGLPQSVAQSYWTWNTAAARKAGLEKPAADGVWTWEEYYELVKKLPIDTDGDGEPDVYLRYGMGLDQHPALEEVDVYIFREYLDRYPENMERFWTDYFDMFKEMFMSDAILRGGPSSDGKMVLIENSSLTPIHQMGSVLPLPVFDEEDCGQLGRVSAWVVNKNAEHMDLAADFMKVYTAEDTHIMNVDWSETMLVAQKAPKYRVKNASELQPVFAIKNGIQTAEVHAGREIKTGSFGGGSFSSAQKYRENFAMQKITSTPNGRYEFFSAVWAYVNDWIVGNITEQEMQEGINYLVNMAIGE